ncbi:Proton myo-inositol cotransporter [Holothuria leucospilota]|uniref:Proton myo-inositol cotransporter n=1 Tax=Holothuria leucospilota TaxID=206669 RepID=A0A9Q1CK40_HOLLE|nr:Proton myo-inositol cotransporter [Holothuria leucospilota]
MTSEVVSLERMASINSDTNPPTTSYTKNGVPDSPGQTVEATSYEASSLNPVVKEPFTLYLKVLAGFAAIGGFLFGYDTGVVSGALILLKQEFTLTTVWQEIFVSITIFAAAISAVFGGLLNDRFGRRPVILISSSVFLAGAVILASAYNKEMLIIGRAVVGVGVGLASMTVPMYIAEASPPHARGTLVTINNLFITGGQFVASVVDGIFSYWPAWGWRCMLGLAGVPALIQLVGFIFLPESPRWLILHGKHEKGKKVLHNIYGPSVYMREYEQISHSAEKEAKTKRIKTGHPPTIKRMLKSPTVRRALILGCGLQMFQQLAGINTVMYYSASIIRMSGVQSDIVVIWLASAVAFVNFSFTLVGVYCMERLGRRKLGLASMAGVALSQVFLTVAFVLISQTSPDVISVYNGTNSTCSSYHSCDSCIIHEGCGFCFKSFTNNSVENSFCLEDSSTFQNESDVGPCSRSEIHASSYTWAFDFCPSPVSFLAFIGLILYLMFFAPGMGPLPWTVNAEIFPQWARSTGNAITSAVNWTFNIIVSMTFLTLTEIITRQGTFALYAVICFTGLLFMYLCLPETKGKPLEEVTNLFLYPLFSIGRMWNRTREYQNLSQEEEDDDDNDEVEGDR